MEKEEIIKLISGRIIDEYRKHPDLDWAEIAARKLYAQWSEFYIEQSRQAAVSDSCRFYEQDNTTAMNCKHCGKGKWMHGNGNLF